jgi:hypothetical protein
LSCVAITEIGTGTGDGIWGQIRLGKIQANTKTDGRIATQINTDNRQRNGQVDSR